MTDEAKSKEDQLAVLNQHLDEVKKLQPTVAPTTKSSGDAARAAIDFASATAVGSVLGYGFDMWQHTLPWGLLVGLLIGTAAGIKLMFQAENNRPKSD